MSDTGDILLVTGDANVRSYERSFDQLRITLVLWDESTKVITATGVGRLEDSGTWECDAIVRYPPFDDESSSSQGFAIIDVDGVPTLRFAATGINLDDADPA